MKAFQFGPHFAHLIDGGATLSVPNDDIFWSERVMTLPPGRLVSRLPHEADWTNWERHPMGEELIIGLSGEIEFVLDMEKGEQRVRVREGDFIIVPQGIWHTADVINPGDAIYITPGKGRKTGRGEK